MIFVTLCHIISPYIMKAITAAKLSKMGIGFALAYLTYKLVSSVDVSGHLIKAFKRKVESSE